MLRSLRRLFGRTSAPADRPAPLRVTELEARENPAAWVAGYWDGGWDARPGDVLVVGERHAVIEYGSTGVRVVLAHQTVELPYWQLRGDARVVVHGTEGADYIDNWTGYSLTAYANGGDDYVWGGWGHDRIHGGWGNDHLRGHDGNDTLYGDDGHDRLQGEAGEDALYGWNGNDVLEGNDGHDRLFGEGDNDWLYGDGWDCWWDNFFGGPMYGNRGTAGNDIIDGGSGLDSMAGGAGRDVFYGSRNWVTTRQYFLGILVSTDTRTDVVADVNWWENDWRA